MHNTVQYTVICCYKKVPLCRLRCCRMTFNVKLLRVVLQQNNCFLFHCQSIFNRQILFNISLALFFLSTTTTTSINIMQMLQFKVDKKEPCLHICPAIQSKSFIFHLSHFDLSFSVNCTFQQQIAKKQQRNCSSYDLEFSLLTLSLSSRLSLTMWAELFLYLNHCILPGYGIQYIDALMEVASIWKKLLWTRKVSLLVYRHARYSTLV